MTLLRGIEGFKWCTKTVNVNVHVNGLRVPLWKDRMDTELFPSEASEEIPQTKTSNRSSVLLWWAICTGFKKW